MSSVEQYPKDYNPPFRGKCEVCGYETRGWTDRWLVRCPKHWRELLVKNRKAAENAT